MIEVIAYAFIIVGAIGVLSLYAISNFLYVVLFIAIIFLLMRVLSVHR